MCVCVCVHASEGVCVCVCVTNYHILHITDREKRQTFKIDTVDR